MKRFCHKETIKNFIVIFSFILLNEIVFRLVMHGAFNDWSILRIIFEDIIITGIVTLFTSLFKNIGKKITNISLGAVITLYSFFQLGFYTYIGTYMSLNTSSQADKVVDYLSDFISSYTWDFYLILIPLVLLILFYIFWDKKITDEEPLPLFWPRLLILTIVMINVVFFYLTINLSFMQNKYQMMSNKDLFKNPEIQNIAVNQYGITGFAILDIKSFIMPGTVEADNYEYEKNKKKTIQTDTTRNIDDYSWNQVIANEQNSTYQSLNNYYINRTITSKNEHTGLFKDKNVIFILMESVSDIILQYPQFYPNIAKLYNEGWAWTNNYSPRNSCATGNNEMTIMSSLYTIANSCTANTYKRNLYPEAVFNIFNNAGYSTSSYHDYIDAYYSRKTIHPNMGSMKYYNAVNLGIQYNPVYQEWPSDVLLVEKASEIFLQQPRFMAFLTTVTGHQPYRVYSEFGDKHLDLFKDIDTSITVKRYMSKIKETDLAIGRLLEILEAKGIMEDTVLVLTGDHYPYGMSNSQNQSVLNYDININNEKDHTPFIIYNPTITPQKHDEYTTIMNILPTVANLFDLNYDPRLYMGEDLFSDKYSGLAIFADGSWQSKNAFYQATTGKITYMEGASEIAGEEIINTNQRINLLIKMSNLAIRNDYFNYLAKAKEKYPHPNNANDTQSTTEEVLDNAVSEPLE